MHMQKQHFSEGEEEERVNTGQYFQELDCKQQEYGGRI